MVAVFDEHYPHTIPAYFDVGNPKRETPFLKFLRDFQPHIILHGGDQLDLDCIAHWNRGKPRLLENKRLGNVYDDYNYLLDGQEKVLKHCDELVMLEGNHDYWIEDLLDENPVLEGMLEIPRGLRLKSRGYKWIEQRKHYKIGKVYFLHGDFKRGYLPSYHAKAIAQIYGRSVIYGHFHTNQVYSAVTPFDEHPYQCTSIGCMSNVNPIWQRNAASAWVNAFAVIFILPDGNFSAQIINVVNDQFVWDSQLYK